MEIVDLVLRRLVGTYSSPNLAASERIEADFLEVHTDIGITGIFGPIHREYSILLLGELRQRVLGANPLANEWVWHEAYRSQRHGRNGYYMIALSALDCALWDLKGKVFGCPVYELLGGPVQSSVACYATMLGFNPDEDKAMDIAIETRDKGFVGQKWALRGVPEEGHEGLRRNVRRIARLRESLGSDYPLMFDALGKWNSFYTIDVCRLAQPFHITWLEEPLSPAMTSAMPCLRQACGVPLAAGEHLYTRHEAHHLLVSRAVDFLQPDVAWCGGITEAVKIAALSSVWDVPLIPHGNGLIPALHVAASQPYNIIPMLEYHVTLEPKRQHFFKNKFAPTDGRILLPKSPGLGIEIDVENIVESEEVVCLRSL